MLCNNSSLLLLLTQHQKYSSTFFLLLIKILFVLLKLYVFDCTSVCNNLELFFLFFIRYRAAVKDKSEDVKTQLQKKQTNCKLSTPSLTQLILKIKIWYIFSVLQLTINYTSCLFKAAACLMGLRCFVEESHFCRLKIPQILMNKDAYNYVNLYLTF